VVELVDTLL